MTDLSRRSAQTELMDLPETPPADYARALADLARVNRVTLTHRPVLQWLDAVTRPWERGSQIVVLDVASGQGDLLRAIHRWAIGRGLVPVLCGLDLNPASAVQAAASTPAAMAITWRTGDVFLDTPTPAPDFIVTSQFTHHLDDDQVVRFLQWIDAHAARGWFIADLHRHVIPYYGFRLLARVMGWHRIVRIDGTTSIARSFRKAEWRALLARARIVAEVAWRPMFRLCVSRRA